jgi:hypothetical protein
VAERRHPPELKAIFADEPIYRRTGIVICYQDPTFRGALDNLLATTGPTHIIIAGVTVATCCAMPTLSMLNDGLAAHPVVDACGAWNDYEAHAAMGRMSRAGAALATVFALGCELPADGKRPTADAMFDPFTNELPEYGFVIQNFWNNAPARAPRPVGHGQVARVRGRPASSDSDPSESRRRGLGRSMPRVVGLVPAAASQARQRRRGVV